MRMSCCAGCVLAVLLSACAPSAVPEQAEISDVSLTNAPGEMAASDDAAETASASSEQSPVKSAGTDPAEIDAVILDWDQVEDQIAARKGKIVVVDLWSTDCVPCLREFPHLVELQNKYPDDVACLSVSLDYIGLEGKPPESYQPKVVNFLREQQAKMFNVISSVDSDRLFDRLGLGSIPAVYIYSRDGQLAKRFDDDEGLYGPEGFTYKEQINPFVEELLNQK